jgi:hypothetical protein
MIFPQIISLTSKSITLILLMPKTFSVKANKAVKQHMCVALPPFPVNHFLREVIGPG